MKTDNSMISEKDSKAYEDAIKYLVGSYARSGHNPKPVIFHSIRIAYKLLELGYGLIPVQAAILHDLIEDADVTEADIRMRFGDEVADTVVAVSMNMDIKDYAERYKEMFSRTVKAGANAIIVKTIDLYDNGNYYRLVKDKELLKNLISKVQYFLEMTNKYADESIWKMLAQQIEVQKRESAPILEETS